MNRAAVWIAISTVGLLALVQDVQSQDAERELSNIKRLHEKLFKNYDKSVRPVTLHTNSTVVKLSLFPLYVIEMNEEKSFFTLDTWLDLVWKDQRLTWNKTEYNGLDTLHISGDLVWQPDLTIYNSHSSNINPKQTSHLRLESDGHIYYFPPATITSYCALDIVDDYPNDIKVCNIDVGSWTHDGWQIDLQLLEKNVINFDGFDNSNPRWEVLKELCNVSREVMHYNCCEEPYITIVSSFTMKRRIPPQLQVIRDPCILVILLTLAMFWIPPDSGKKLTLGAFLMIILTVLLIYVASVTRSPKAPRIAVSFIRPTICAIASAILLETVVINIGRILGPCRPPQLLVKFLSGSAGKFICVFAPVDTSVQLKEDAEKEETQLAPKEEWLLVATAADRLLFLIYIVVMAAIHKI